MHSGKVKKQRDPARERFWRRMIRRQEQSGLSARAFCKQRKLVEPTFYFWRGELARRDAESARRSGPSRMPIASLRKASRASISTKRRGRPLWAQLRVAPAELSTASAAIEIVFPAGVRVRVGQGADPQVLADVLAALEPRSC